MPIPTPFHFSIQHEPMAENRHSPRNNPPGIVIGNFKTALCHTVLLLAITSHPSAAGRRDDRAILEASIP